MKKRRNGGGWGEEIKGVKQEKRGVGETKRG